MPTTVHIVRTGAANLASVVAAFERLGVASILTTDPDHVRNAAHLVLPGVGAFGPAMASLRAANLVEPLRNRILTTPAPTLAICLGLQLLAESSDESPGEPGLGILPARITRFTPRDNLTVPQMGWNRAAAPPTAALLRDAWVYYANSYKLDAPPAGWNAALSTYGAPFVAALERGPILACQFHPELSGADGLALLARWLNPAAAGPRVPARAAPPASPVRIIPCLDVAAGRVVKGVKFQNLRDAGDPVAQAAEYERQGADELVMLDVSATPDGRRTAADTVRALRRVLSVPLTVGGGVRTLEDAARLLEAGADKVGVNTAAVERPALIADLARRFGRQCVVLAIDAARRPGGWEVVVHSGKTRTGLDAVAWAARGADLGAGEILLTSYDRDGTGEGYDLELLRAVAAAVRVPVVASGGARTAAHLAAAVAAGAGAVLAASIFHDGVHTVDAVKSELNLLGVPVRTERA